MGLNMKKAANLNFEIGDIISHPKLGLLTVVQQCHGDTTERKNKFLLKRATKGNFYHYLPYYGLFIEKDYVVSSMEEVS